MNQGGECICLGWPVLIYMFPSTPDIALGRLDEFPMRKANGTSSPSMSGQYLAVRNRSVLATIHCPPVYSADVSRASQTVNPNAFVSSPDDDSFDVGHHEGQPDTKSNGGGCHTR
jgi:hypothetical protein